ncbi:hypothetical protein IWZ03DRAFT_363836 [Phyllosticta citriasiana]|uniref:Uncharacterized protein n=1 Tax=Phyllosticta citriasiana TaxID=595635 RepID=A0ABR1KB07_9PEZI
MPKRITLVAPTTLKSTIPESTPCSGGRLHLFPKNGKKLVERSLVNVDGGKTYRGKGQYLVRYQDFGEKDPDYRLEDDLALSFLRRNLTPQAEVRLHLPSGRPFDSGYDRLICR